MANIGLARLVIAKYLSSGRYEDGMRIHKAIKVELDPVYEDASDYKDMTDLEEESTFMYSDIKLSIGCAPEEVELEVLGREIDNNQVVSSAKDNSACIGIGFRTREKVHGIVKYVAIWICKAKLYEESQTYNTIKESIEHGAITLKGKAVPDDTGRWRIKKTFETKEEADSWVDEMAGFKKEEV